MPKAINYKLLICYLPVVSLVFLFLYLGFYGTASSDDYADYMQVEKFGYLNTVKETYLHWGGRFTSYILVYPINPLNFGELNGPAIFNFLQISLFTFLSFLFSKYITKKNLKSIEFCICFSLLSLLLYCYLPKPVELLFWFTGSWVYLPGLIGLCYWLMLFEKEYINKVEKIVFILLPFFVAGTNELNLFIQAWLLFILRFIFKPKKIFWLAIVSFSVGAFIALSTPGNYQRSDFFLLQAHHPARDLLFSLKNSFNLSFYYLKDWLRSSPILLIWLSLSFVLPMKKIIIDKKLLILILVSFLMVPLLFFLFVYGTGMITLPARLLNVVFIFIVLGGSAIFPRILQNYLPTINRFPQLAGFIGIILIFQASYSSRLRTALFDTKELTAYSIEINQRIQLAKNQSLTSPNDTLIVPAIKHIPYSIFYSDLSPNAGHWYNQGFAYYHRIKAVKIMEKD